MQTRDFDFELPPALIAQEPPLERGTSRLLVLSRATGAVRHAAVADLPTLLHAGDLVVVNDTRVFPARLLGTRVPSGGAVECLLIAPVPAADSSSGQEHDQLWEALVHPGQKLKPGAHVRFGGDAGLEGEILERRFFGRRLVRLRTTDGSPVTDAIERVGHVPLPPYIKRPDTLADRERYQTVFAERSGSVAAPTAGLHFTEPLVAALRAAGIAVVSITLHVGYGTFQPVRDEDVAQHRMDAERYSVTPETAAAIAEARQSGRRVIAVGTTTTRTLEAVALGHGGAVAPGEGRTDLFIYPGFRFQVISGLLTNFHLPKSSLLMLVAAFAGLDPVMRAYREAVAQGYRFYSYGDAMLIV
ncbi:MAG: tRNA preQ1(34) S-adenosylmethionine ribosyltransferase-isomerase QueA [Vicinamibacterales bacterium]